MARPMPLLHFTVRRKLQKTAVTKFGEREQMPSASTFTGQVPTTVEGHLRRNRSDLAAFRRISRNAGRRMVDRVRKEVRAKDLYIDGLFLSSWRTTLVDSAGNGLVADISLRNDAPYALYVHPKRTPPSRTFVNYDLEPITKVIESELAEDQAEFLAAIMARVVADIARQAIIDATVGR